MTTSGRNGASPVGRVLTRKEAARRIGGQHMVVHAALVRWISPVVASDGIVGRPRRKRRDASGAVSNYIRRAAGGIGSDAIHVAWHCDECGVIVSDQPFGKHCCIAGPIEDLDDLRARVIELARAGG